MVVNEEAYRVYTVPVVPVVPVVPIPGTITPHKNGGEIRINQACVVNVIKNTHTSITLCIAERRLILRVLVC
jgi:hypothetical protein